MMRRRSETIYWLGVHSVGSKLDWSRFRDGGRGQHMESLGRDYAEF